MPLLSLSSKNTMLQALAIDSLSLHTDYSGTGANEVSGGVPAYARLAALFGPPSLGTCQLVGGPYVFDVPPITTIAWVGMWAAGIFVGMVPNGGGIPVPFAVDDLVQDTLKCAQHGFNVDDQVVTWAGAAVPPPLELGDGASYFVVAITPDTLQLSDVLGGVPIALSTTGDGFLQRIVPVSFLVQSTFLVNNIQLNANVAA